MTSRGMPVGTGALIRLALRRDRILLPAWVIGLPLVAAFSVTATKDLYPDEKTLATAAEAINATASLVALYGKVYDPGSLGAVSLIKMTAFGAALVAVLFVFLVVRHSRREEEAGRLELVGAGIVGRAAPLAAALAVGMGASLVLGLLTALGLAAVGLPWSGCLAFGLSWALTGVVFSAVAGVAAQLTVSARAAIGLGLGAVGVAYALRAVGDLAEGDPGWLSWLSPIGWSQQLRPFAGDRWWVTILPILASAVLVPVAFALRARRDLGSGLLQDRLGPAHGRLRGVEGLAWRLQRGMLLAWLLGGALLGLVLGSVAHNLTGLLDSPQMRDFILRLGGEQALADAFLAAELAILGSITGAYAIASAIRLRHEEEAGRVEPVLATATTRLRWASSHLGLSVLGTAVLLLVIGTAVGLGHALATADAGQVPRLAAAGLAHVPAAWVMTGLVVLLFGWQPRWVPAAWGLLVVFVIVGEFGALWQLPEWVRGLSPFDHSPTVPGGSWDIPGLLVLTLVAAALTAVGLVGWRRRDLQA